MPDCENCKKKNSEEMQVITIPIVTYEKDEQRKERREKRYIFVIILMIVLFVGSNAGWLYYESQMEEVTTITETTLDANGDGIANYIGNDGDIIYGEDYSKNNNENTAEEKEETAGQMSDLR